MAEKELSGCRSLTSQGAWNFGHHVAATLMAGDYMYVDAQHPSEAGYCDVVAPGRLLRQSGQIGWRHMLCEWIADSLK